LLKKEPEIENRLNSTKMKVREKFQ